VRSRQLRVRDRCCAQGRTPCSTDARKLVARWLLGAVGRRYVPAVAGDGTGELVAGVVFGVLGPLEVSGVCARRLGGAKQRALLADLVLHAGRVVPIARLVEDLWGSRPPPSADHTIEAYVSRLRRILTECDVPAAVSTAPPGYRLDVAAEWVDLGRFRQLTAAAESDGGRARDLRVAAEALWRGDALADLREVPFVPAAALPLDDARLANTERRIELDMTAGQHLEVIGQLEALVCDHPDRERLTGQLMLALYRGGRQVDALAAYRRTRERLIGVWGIEPGPELQALEQAVLRQDAALELGNPTQATGSAFAAAQPGDLSASVRGQPWRRLGRAGRVLVVAVMAAALAAGRGPAHRPERVPANGVAILDTYGRVLARAPLPAPPSRAVATARTLWVSSPEGQRVFRVDAGTGAVVQAVPVGAGASELAAAGRTVWVANTLDGTVTRISTTANAAVQTVPVGSQPASMVVAGDHVLVALPGQRAIAVIDAVSGRVERSIATDLAPFGLAVTGASVWFTSPDTDVVERIDAISGASVQRVPVGAGPTAVVAAFGSVWVANASDSTVTRIDASTAAVTATIPVGAGPVALSAGEGRLWVANRTAGTVAAIDPRQDRISRTLRIENRPQGLAVAGGRVLVALRPGRAPPGHRGGTVQALSHDPIPSIDPAVSWPNDPPQLFDNTYDTLVTYRRAAGADGLQLVPDLALAIPTPTGAGTTYTFVLRAGLRYDTGAAVRPADFRHGLERVFSLNPGASSYYAAVDGASRCTAGAPCDLSRGIHSDDRTRTLTFHLSHPDPDFLHKLAFVSAAPVPLSVPAHDVGTSPVPSTGPYRISRFVPRHELVLARNPEFHQWSSAAQPDGFPDRIVWTFGHSVASQVAAVQAGTADWSIDPVPDPALLAARYPNRTHSNPMLGIAYAAFSVNIPPFNDIRVRQAVSLAADRAAVAAEFGGPRQAQPTCQVIPPGLTGYQPFCPFTVGQSRSESWLGPDLARARQLVRASGTEGMHVTLDQRALDASLGRAVSRVLGSLGYRVDVRTLSDSQWPLVVNDSRRRPQASVAEWIVDFPSPADLFPLFFACDAFRLSDPAHTRSNTFFCDPALDRTMTAAAQTELRNPAASAALWSQIDHAITSQAIWVPLVSLKATDFVSARVRNYTYHPVLGIMLDQLWQR
jgi:YVTN family beta-propeller protein